MFCNGDEMDKNNNNKLRHIYRKYGVSLNYTHSESALALNATVNPYYVVILFSLPNRFCFLEALVHVIR